MPPFSFTQGLGDYELPELIVFSLNPDVSEELLGRVINQMLEGALVLVDGMAVENAATVQLKARELDANLFNSFVVPSFSPSTKHRILTKFFQIVLPDKNGRFPGDVGCDTIMNYSQTIEALLEGATDSLPAQGDQGFKIRF